MAFQAVGWLSGKLGVDISGQQKGQQQQPPPQQQQSSHQLQTTIGGFDGQQQPHQQQQYPPQPYPQQYPPQNGGPQFHDEQQPPSVSNYYANQGQQQGQAPPAQPLYQQQPQGYEMNGNMQGGPAPPQQYQNGGGYPPQHQFGSDQQQPQQQFGSDQQQQQQQQQSGFGAWGAKVGGWVNKEKLQTWAQKANQGMGTMGKYVFGDESGGNNSKVERDMFGNEISAANGHNSATGASSGQPAPRLTGADDMRDADENGLPGTRNWFIYSAEQKRWVVSDDAPEDVKAEYYAKLEEAENERLGIKKYVPPPPPPPTGGSLPPPPQGGLAQGQPRLMYAQNEFFGNTSPSGPAPSYSGTFQPLQSAPPTQQPMAPVFFNPVAPQQAPQQPTFQPTQVPPQQAMYSPPPPPAMLATAGTALPPPPAAIHSNSTTALDHSQQSHGDEVGVPEAFVPTIPATTSAPTMPPPPMASTLPPPPAPPSFPLPPFPQAPTF